MHSQALEETKAEKGHKAVCFNFKFTELATMTGDETGLASPLLLKGYTTPPGSMPPTLYEQHCGFYTLFPLALTCKKTDVNLSYLECVVVFNFLFHLLLFLDYKMLVSQGIHLK